MRQWPRDSAAIPMTDMFEPAEEAENAVLDAPAPEAPAGAAPIDQQAPSDPAKADLAAKPEKEQPFWYRKEIEKERKAKAALEREVQELRQQRQPPANAPDPRQDPAAYFETQRIMDRLERSEDRFIDKHGEPELESVKDWLTTRPDIEAWAIQQRHPWAAAHEQFKREKLSAEIGDDPNAWREQERLRIRDEVLAEMGDPGAGAMSAPPAPRLPQSAASVRSAAPRGPIEKKSPFTHKFG